MGKEGKKVKGRGGEERGGRSWREKIFISHPSHNNYWEWDGNDCVLRKLLLMIFCRRRRGMDSGEEKEGLGV